MSPAEIADESTKERTLKDTISGVGGGRQPMKEDFLNAIEEERQ